MASGEKAPVSYTHLALGLYNSRIVKLINKKGMLKSSVIIAFVFNQGGGKKTAVKFIRQAESLLVGQRIWVIQPPAGNICLLYTSRCV